MLSCIVHDSKFIVFLLVVSIAINYVLELGIRIE